MAAYLESMQRIDYVICVATNGIVSNDPSDQDTGAR